ncbi:MAG: hypothetical protein AB1589_32280 [Cyanobacteriota bacterium]
MLITVELDIYAAANAECTEVQAFRQPNHLGCCFCYIACWEKLLKDERSLLTGVCY